MVALLVAGGGFCSWWLACLLLVVIVLVLVLVAVAWLGWSSALGRLVGVVCPCHLPQ